MHRWEQAGWGRLALFGTLMLVGGLMVAGGCGTESAVSGMPSSGPSAPGISIGHEPSPRAPTPVRSPTVPPPTCPASGAVITVGPVEAALGHRAVVVKLTNCRSMPITVNGYPEVIVLDARRRPMKVTVAHGISYMAIDPGPARIRLNKGETALAAVSWSSTVEVAEDKLSGSYLQLARRAGERPVVRPVDTDLGTTTRITVTAWCRKFPN